MSTMAQRVASVLLPGASSPAVVDMLFAASNAPRLGQTPVSPGIAGSYRGKSLAHALAVCSHSQTDPAVLSEYSKDSRVSVREAVLANPNTPLESVLRLTAWAFERCGMPAAHAIQRLSATQLVEVLESAARGVAEARDFPTRQLVERIVATRDLPLITRFATLCGTQTAPALAGAVAKASLPEGALSEVVAAIPEDVRARALSSLPGDLHVLTREVARLAVEYASTSEDAFYYFEPTLVEEGAAEILLGGAPLHVKRALILGAAESAALTALKRFRAPALSAVVAVLPDRHFSVAFEKALAGRLVEVVPGCDRDYWGEPVVDLKLALENLRHPLSETLLADLLRAGSATITSYWLRMREARPNGPRRGVLPLLMADPGKAFTTTARSSYSMRSRGPVDEVLEGEDRERFVASNSSALTVEVLGAELAVLLDTFVGHNIAIDQYGVIATPLIEAALGDNVEAWQTLLTLASDWSGTLSELIAAACSLTGCEVLTPTAETIEPKRTSTPADQLVLA